MHEQHQQSPHGARARGDVIAGPRLELPRFQFSTNAALARPAAAPAPQPQPQPFSRAQASAPQYRPAASPPPPAQHAQPAAIHQQPTWHATPTAMQQPVAVTWAAQHQQHRQAAQPQPQAAPPAPTPQRPPMRTPLTATTSRPATTVTWDRIDPPGEPTFLQRITPVHMGVLLVIVMIAMIAGSGPSTLAVTPARLPAIATGGGAGAGADPLLPRRAGARAATTARVNGARATTAARSTTAAAATGNASHGTPARVRARAGGAGWIIVGNARLRRAVRAGGIPSPAAAANLMVAGGGRVPANSTDSVQLRGIPSAAAAENLGPQKLPYRPTDGVTLPRMVGERDSYGVDSHYGRDTLPMEAAVASPALTPGQAAENAQQRAILADMGATEAATYTGGGFTAY